MPRRKADHLQTEPGNSDGDSPGGDNLEIVNGGRLQDTPACEILWDSILSAPDGRKVFAVGSDDNHYKEANVGRGWIMVNADSLTKSDILKSIRNGDFYATTGVILSNYQVKGNIINIEAENGDRIEFIGKNGTLLKKFEGNKAKYRLKPKDYYVRIKVMNAEGKAAWTQPVFAD